MKKFKEAMAKKVRVEFLKVNADRAFGWHRARGAFAAKRSRFHLMKWRYKIGRLRFKYQAKGMRLIFEPA